MRALLVFSSLLEEAAELKVALLDVGDSVFVGPLGDGAAPGAEVGDELGESKGA